MGCCADHEKGSRGLLPPRLRHGGRRLPALRCPKPRNRNACLLLSSPCRRSVESLDLKSAQSDHRRRACSTARSDDQSSLRQPRQPQRSRAVAHGFAPGLTTGLPLSRMKRLQASRASTSGADRLHTLFAGKPARRRACFDVPRDISESRCFHAASPYLKTRSASLEVKSAALIILGKFFQRPNRHNQGAPPVVDNGMPWSSPAGGAQRR